MSKTKTPFFGLEAHGSVGGSITAQALPKETLVRTKPLPTYRYTLPQTYQRWLYHDYAYLWRQQSAATQAEYRSAGVRYHLTGFQYWMKDMLTRLPDIAGWWKFDIQSAGLTPDSSRNTNTATVIGATPSAGIIDLSYSFDGLNDRVDVPASLSLNTTTARTLIVFFNPPPFDPNLHFIEHQGVIPGPSGDQIYNRNAINAFDIDFFTTAGWVGRPNIPFVPGTWMCAGYTWDGANFQPYVQGLPYLAPLPLAGTFDVLTRPVNFAHRALANWGNSVTDNVILFNRALDATEMARWALRRYPP